MNIHFTLRKQGKADPVIILQVFDSRFVHRKFLYSTGASIPEKQWDKRKGRAKVAGARSEEHSELNRHLDKLSQAVIDFLSVRHNSSRLDRDDLRKHLEGAKKDERREKEDKVQKEVDFFIVWQRIIDTSKNSTGEPIAKNTRVSKMQTLSLLRQFALDHKLTPTFESVDMDFYHLLDQYMNGRKLSANSRGKHFKEIKSILREAEERDVVVNRSYLKKSFKVIRKETDSTYLNETELKQILLLDIRKACENYDAEHQAEPSYKKSKWGVEALEKLRDLFVMACFVGARHSDWHQVNRGNVTNEKDREVIRIKQKKTGSSTHVPVHPVVRYILNKYDGHPPRVISNQKFNDAIKEICKVAGLGTCTIEGKKVDKWGEISTHTARRSFATNAYLSRSMDVHQIMRCTGHKTEASFLRYLKLNGKDYATLAAESKFFDSSEWSMLKVVA